MSKMEARRGMTQFLTTTEGSVLVPLHAREGRSTMLGEPRHVSRSLSRDAQRRLSGNTDSLNAMVLYASSNATAELVKHAQDLPDPVRRPRVQVTKASDDMVIYEYEQKHQDDDNDSEGEAAVDDDVELAKPVRRISSSPSIPRLAGYSMVEATVDEFENTFGHRHASPHESLHEDMIECELLFTLTEELHKQITIQRLVLQPRGVGASARRRDFVVVQCQKRFRLRDGRQGWVQSLHSVGVPTHHRSNDCVRGRIHRSGVVAIESAVHNKTLDVIVTAQVDLQGNASRGAHRAVSKRRITKVMGSLKHALAIRRVETLPFPGTHRFLEMEFEQKDRKCKLCDDKLAWLTIPGWLSARHTCRNCGATVCGACSHVWTIERQRTTTMVGGGRVMTATRVCNRCVVPTAQHKATAAMKRVNDSVLINMSPMLRRWDRQGSNSDRSTALFAQSHNVHRPPSTATLSGRYRPSQLEFQIGSERVFSPPPLGFLAEEGDNDGDDDNDGTMKTIHLRRHRPAARRQS